MTAPESADRPPVIIDPRPRQLLERYASLTGGIVMEVGEALLRVEIPESERRFWDDADVICLALAPEALDADPEAELLGIGSPMFEKLLGAVRIRGFLDHRGSLPSTLAPDQLPPAPTVLEGAEAAPPVLEVVWVPIGRLLARISIQAGPRIEERLVESPLVDLSSGVRLPADIQVPESAALVQDTPAGQRLAPRRPTVEFLPLLFEELEAEIREDVDRLRAEAAGAMQTEVDRLIRYYDTMLEEVEPEEDPEAIKAAKKAIRAERDRRTNEEKERYTVRVVVHPLQLTEWSLPTQAATWPLITPKGTSASISAVRPLVGQATWSIRCPTCGIAAGITRVCEAGHACCPACSERCGVCSTTTCRTHGATTCTVEGHSVCREHARTCRSCGEHHCATHSQRCDLGDHDVCPSCAQACGRCGVALCRAHGIQTGEATPRGQRWLCAACTTYCEGGSNEPIGLDEAARCASCERYVCTHHQAVCTVDGLGHCSKHLRRSDHSGRLVCEHHRGSCADEPKAVLASDEVVACATCGRSVCDEHGAPCDADGARHCRSHLKSLADLPGRHGCERHRTVCHVDQVTFSTAATRPCPICERRTCQRHESKCRNCHRNVCISDLREGLCLTCGRLQEVTDPSDDLLQAAVTANGGEPPRAKGWRWARDPSDTVVSIELGWGRRLVFTHNDGTSTPKTAVLHGLLGARRIR